MMPFQTALHGSAPDGLAASYRGKPSVWRELKGPGRGGVRASSAPLDKALRTPAFVRVWRFRVSQGIAVSLLGAVQVPRLCR